MKKLLASIIVLLGISLQSNAANSYDNPLVQVREVIRTYQTDAGKFQQLTKAQQEDFYKAAGVVKSELSSHKDFISEARAKEIDKAVNVFRFIWESRPEVVEIDLSIKAPEVI